MRIKVVGNDPVAHGLRGLLQQHNFQIVNHMPTYVIDIAEQSDLTQPTIDGVDSEFERVMVAELANLAGSVLVLRGHNDDKRAVLRVPSHEEAVWNAQRAVWRALSIMRKDKKSWFEQERG